MSRSAAWFEQRLAPPRARPRIVIDTDAANEIDDQFALAWALLSPERLDVLAVYAAPFSFEHRRQEMRRALAARAAPASASAFDLALLQQHGATLDRFAQRDWSLDAIGHWPVFCTPGEGMLRSFDEIVRVFGLLRLSPAGRVFRGGAGYLADERTPLMSEAALHLIATARATPIDGEPLYVVAIGCVTNIASALLAAPDIAERIVVVWTAGYPSHAPQINFSLNLEQDLAASRVLFDSGVPLVYLPGFHVGAQLRLVAARGDAACAAARRRRRRSAPAVPAQPADRLRRARRARAGFFVGDLGCDQHRVVAERRLGAEHAGADAGAERGPALARAAWRSADARGVCRRARCDLR